MTWLEVAHAHLVADGFTAWIPAGPPGAQLLADNGNIVVVLIRTEREGDVRRIAHEVRHAARAEGANRLVVVLIDPPDAHAREKWTTAAKTRGADPDLLFLELPEGINAAVLIPLTQLGTTDPFLRAVEDNDLVSAIDPALSSLGVEQPLKGALAADLHVFLEGGQWYNGPPYPQTRSALGLGRGAE